MWSNVALGGVNVRGRSHPRDGEAEPRGQLSCPNLASLGGKPVWLARFLV